MLKMYNPNSIFPLTRRNRERTLGQIPTIICWHLDITSQVRNQIHSMLGLLPDNMGAKLSSCLKKSAAEWASCRAVETNDYFNGLTKQETTLWNLSSTNHHEQQFHFQKLS